MILFPIFAAALYAIIGGPSVGKTSIVNSLEKQGNLVCHESATDIIASKQKNGNLCPWEDEGFELEIFAEKVSRENSALTKATEENDLIFVDRGLLDTLVYLEVNHKIGSSEHKAVSEYLNSISIKDRYDAVFYVEPYNGDQFHACSDGVRHEDTRESLRLAEKTKQAYIEAGYTPITVPPYLSIEERTAFVLNAIAKQKQAT